MNKKRNIILALALMLSTVMITGLTFAYFSAKSEIKHNTFTIGGVSIQLAEPNFDGLDYGEDESDITLPLDPQLGIVTSKNIMPGRVITKNPSVKNTSTVPVWVAIKVDYKISYTEDTYTSVAWTNEFSAFAKIDFDTTNWLMKTDSDNTVFYYKTSVLPDKNTFELFTSVIINENATELKPFTIDVTAYAIQEEGLGVDVAKAKLDTMME